MKLKKLFCIMLAAALLFALCGCTAPEAAQAVETPAQAGETPAAEPQKTEAPVTGPGAEETPAAEPADSGEPTAEQQRAAEAMLPVLCCAVAAMEGGSGEAEEEEVAEEAYVSSGQVFWSVLRELCAKYGQLHPAAELDEGKNTVCLPYSAVQELASCCFADYTALPVDIPEDMGYDAEKDVFLLKREAAETDYRCVITNVTANEGGLSVLLVKLRKAGSGEEYAAGAYSFQLVENPYLDGVAEPAFPYSVAGAYSAYTDQFIVADVSESGGAWVLTADPVRLEWQAEANGGLGGMAVVNDAEEAILLLLPGDEGLAQADALSLQWALGIFDGPEYMGAEALSYFAENCTKENGGPIVYTANVWNGSIGYITPSFDMYFGG